MSRQPRQISATGFYHVLFRGINRQHLFEDESDYLFFLQILQNLKEEMDFEIHAYCLMSNHVHILLKEKELGEVSRIMKRLLTKYAMYFNRKYERNGTLISDRYKSIPVEVDEYFIPLIRYIHQNPCRAGIVENMEEYAFSSYHEYIRGGALVDKEFSMSLLGRDEWIRVHQDREKEVFEMTGHTKLGEEQIRRKILKCTGGIEPYEMAGLPKKDRDAFIRQLKDQEGLSIRQIQRATGISRGVIARC